MTARQATRLARAYGLPVSVAHVLATLIYGGDE